MRCPKCGKTKSKVIDSRPSKDRVSISRRRECLTCSTRFTTFEATEQNYLSVMIRKNTGSGTTLNSLKTMLNFMTNTLSTLSEENEALVDKVTQLEMMELRNKAKEKLDIKSKKAAGNKSKSARKKKATRKKSRLKKSASQRRKGAGKIIKATATNTICRIVNRFSRGIDIPRLKDRTGFDSGKIGNILYYLLKQGKIKKIGRGSYIPG